MRRDTAASGRLLAACSGGSLTASVSHKARKTNKFSRLCAKMFSPSAHRKEKEQVYFPALFLWRRRRDSNPRYGFIHTTPLAGEPLEPLGYFSKAISIISKRHALCQGFELFIFIKCAINCFIMLVSYGRM